MQRAAIQWQERGGERREERGERRRDVWEAHLQLQYGQDLGPWAPSVTIFQKSTYI